MFDTDYRLVSGIAIINSMPFYQQYLEIILLHYLSLAELAIYMYKVCVDK